MGGFFFRSGHRGIPGSRLLARGRWTNQRGCRGLHGPLSFYPSFHFSLPAQSPPLSRAQSPILTDIFVTICIQHVHKACHRSSALTKVPSIDRTKMGFGDGVVSRVKREDGWNRKMKYENSGRLSACVLFDEQNSGETFAR